jgi:uncharacterized DUF497 family protein/uncharacterized protein (DUF4415 family)
VYVGGKSGLASYTKKCCNKSMTREIEFDPDKENKNWKAHQVHLATAALAFADPRRIERMDDSEGNTSGEERWQTLGQVDKVLFVVYTERGDQRDPQTKRKKGVIMGMTTITVRDGQKPTKEQIQEIRAAVKKPLIYTDDCPESTATALAEFAVKARELRRSMKRTSPTVTIRLSSDCLDKYKSLGKGYTGIMMADVFTYVATHPDYLKQATL